MPTGISWADETWNPLLGCTRVSPGCDGCYAISTSHRWAHSPNPKVADAFTGLTDKIDGRIDWTGQVNVLPDRLTQPLRWRKPRRIFVNSQADLFHDRVPLDLIVHVFAVAAATPRHTFLIATKRHARMASVLRRPTFAAAVADVAVRAYGANPALARPLTMVWPLPNVHLGVSVENQQWADIRIPALLDTPAAVRWISAEPLLGPVNLAQSHIPWAFDQIGRDRDAHALNRVLHWLVVGGESGPKARPMHPDWAKSLRDQAVAARVPFFFKQWGTWSPMAAVDTDGRFRTSGAHTLANDGTLYEPGSLAYPDGPRHGEAVRADHHRAALTHMYRVGAQTAGNELDGRTWHQLPATVR